LASVEVSTHTGIPTKTLKTEIADHELTQR
jgi:hypothetical protein